MSITKSYTEMAIGRAIRLGYLTMADLDKPVVSFLKDVDQSKLVEGAMAVTLPSTSLASSGRHRPNDVSECCSVPNNKPVWHVFRWT
jgi:hypothetical protein